MAQFCVTLTTNTSLPYTITPAPLLLLPMGAIMVHWLVVAVYTSALIRRSFPLNPPQMYTCPREKRRGEEGRGALGRRTHQRASEWQGWGLGLVLGPVGTVLTSRVKQDKCSELFGTGFGPVVSRAA